MSITLQVIALIGFGEAGSILGADLTKAGLRVRCYDLLLEDAQHPMHGLAKTLGVTACTSLPAAIAGADLIISAVTASSSADVARASAAHLHGGQVFMDINSVSPDTKRSNAKTIEASGAAYIEAAVMGPLPPQRLMTPMLLGGSRATELADALSSFGMQVTAVSTEIGVAAAIKMCRSIMIKGIEALALESLLAARRFGAEQVVLESLDRSFPGMGWLAQQPDYLLSRVAEHGKRRAAEMREVALTLESIGMPPLMANATADRQQWLVDEMAKQNLTYRQLQPFSWRSLADQLQSPTTASMNAP